MAFESANDSSLGKATDYVDQYCADLLFPIARAATRENLGLDEKNLPFSGCDIWNAYELSWLNSKGLPQVACAEFRFACDSVAIIESKSFKLYLNSFNQSRFDDWQQVASVLTRDLSKAAGTEVMVSLHRADQPISASAAHLVVEAECLDDQDISVDVYDPSPGLLNTSSSTEKVRLVSHLLRSLCPVTGQPDWGSVYIDYNGPVIDREGLLRYIVGFRCHQEFHEQCVERIYRDIMDRSGADSLSVYARYVRRGGLDINPFRSSHHHDVDNNRLYRQ